MKELSECVRTAAVIILWSAAFVALVRSIATILLWLGQ